MKIHEISYKQCSLECIKSDDQQGDLLFSSAWIHIYISQDFKIFITIKISICDFVNNLRAISFNVTCNPIVSLSTQLYRLGVLHIKQHAQSSYIIEDDHWTKHALFCSIKCLILTLFFCTMKFFLESHMMDTSYTSIIFICVELQCILHASCWSGGLLHFDRL